MKSDHGQVVTGDGRAIATAVQRPRGFLGRARGLLGRRALAEHEGLWIDRCDSIHMFGMIFSIDVVFLRDGTIERLCPAVRPFQARWCRRANSALELPCGSIERLRLQPSLKLEFRSAA
ncbi:MAG TPA: DUF192 domain-containing protein [Tahibacter sp.]|nr:DUF192 domain-containing protein [Tahibacter sp.]